MQEKSNQFPFSTEINPHLGHGKHDAELALIVADVAVIGGGPAGLRAAEVALAAGLKVALFDQKPSPGRKFLLAGKGGLNISNALPLSKFLTHYKGGRPELWTDMLADFSFGDLRAWTAGLGVDTFIGTSERLFPTGKYAAPLLRKWLQRLRAGGLQLFARHKWLEMKRKEMDGGSEGRWRLTFKTMAGEVSGSEAAKAPIELECDAKAVIFAMGGGSYPETGSDGGWQRVFQAHGIPHQPLSAANCGWEVMWPAPLPAGVEGMPVKNITAFAGSENGVATTDAAALAKPGELLLTSYGLEGGLIYHFGSGLRAAARPVLWLNLKPTYNTQQLCDLWRGDKPSLDTPLALDTPEARAIFRKLERAWKLSAAHAALLRSIALGIYCPDPALISSKDTTFPSKRAPESIIRQLLPRTLGPQCTIRALSQLAGQLPVPLSRPRPIDEAISSAGGVCWKALDNTLMLSDFAGLFCAGEMLDWEAPTGGYLLHGALATGNRAGKGAVTYVTP